MSELLLFIDTEFTDFLNMEMISIGLVSLCGQHTFYREINDFNPKRCSRFVRETVLPLLGKEPQAIQPRWKVRAELAAWLVEFEQERILIAFDYEADWLLFQDLLKDVPLRIQAIDIAPMMDVEILSATFEVHQWTPHHALTDAQANRIAYMAAQERGTLAPCIEGSDHADQ